MKIKKYLTAIVLLLSVVDGYSATIDFNDLPQKIIINEFEAENVYGGFLVGGKALAERGSFTSLLDATNFSVFDLTGIASGFATPTNNFLIRYNLDASSNLRYINSKGRISNTLLGGSVWLEVPKTLDLNNDNLINVYREQVQNLDSFTSSPATFYFTAAAALSGSGNVSQKDYFSFTYPNFTAQTGNVSVSGIFICIECGFDITLNLIGLSYDSNGQSSFNILDKRASLMTFYEYVNGINYNHNFSETESLNVQPVPLPSSMGMFASGMLLLLFRVKRCKNILKLKYNTLFFCLRKFINL